MSGISSPFVLSGCVCPPDEGYTRADDNGEWATADKSMRNAVTLNTPSTRASHRSISATVACRLSTRATPVLVCLSRPSPRAKPLARAAPVELKSATSEQG